MSFSYGLRFFGGTARLTNGLPMCLARRNAALAPITFPMYSSAQPVVNPKCATPNRLMTPPGMGAMTTSVIMSATNSSCAAGPVPVNSSSNGKVNT